MKKYGLRIGDVGVEFVSAEERNKALNDFVNGSDVKISDEGIRYKDGINSFSVYDRDTKDVVTNCCICHGVFNIDTCGERDYPYQYYGHEEFSTRNGYICDACLTRKIKDKNIKEAGQSMNKED